MSVRPIEIITPRLILLSATIEHLRCELDHPERLGELLGVQVPLGWPPGQYDRDAMQFFLEKSLQGSEGALGWYGWYAIRRANDVKTALLVGSAGYFGPPSKDGIAEIGYSIVEEERRKGYATEMIRAMTARALEFPNVKHVVAEVHETNVPSFRALERCGFVRVEPGRDEGHWRYFFRASKTSLHI